MNTQAIIQILDDIAKESIESFGKSIEPDMYPTWIKTAKERISSLPSLDIDSLQRYTVGNEKEGGGYEYHECVRYDDVVNLIK